LKPALFGSSFL